MNIMEHIYCHILFEIPCRLFVLYNTTSNGNQMESNKKKLSHRGTPGRCETSIIFSW